MHRRKHPLGCSYKDSAFCFSHSQILLYLIVL
uniref:Uncharacterized protein n=1 Tax=Anguilla anguilla TaxID=7936 RepID=A0A0E9W8H8_ANGAN